MGPSSASTSRRKKFLLPFLSAAAVMLLGALAFFMPPPSSTQFHETMAGQYRRVILTPGITVALDERSAIAVTNSVPLSIELIRGNAYFDNHNASAPVHALEIVFGEVRFSSNGASFSLEMLNNGGSVAISNGQMEINMGGQSHLASAGQRINFNNNRVTQELAIKDADIAPWRR